MEVILVSKRLVSIWPMASRVTVMLRTPTVDAPVLLKRTAIRSPANTKQSAVHVELACLTSAVAPLSGRLKPAASRPAVTLYTVYVSVLPEAGALPRWTARPDRKPLAGAMNAAAFGSVAPHPVSLPTSDPGPQ